MEKKDRAFLCLALFGALRLSDPKGRDTWLLCQPCDGESASFAVLSGWQAAVSADPQGFAIFVLTQD